MSMSADILREIVSTYFEVDAKQIILSGELQPDRTFENYYKNGSMGSNEDIYEIYGFDALEGIQYIKNVVGVETSSNYAHTSSVYRRGVESYLWPNIGKYLFVIIKHRGYNDWEGSETDFWNTYTLYKCPNFQEHRDKLEDADIIRWKKWIEC